MVPVRRLQAEVTLIMLGWTGLFMASVGPFVGATLPGFNTPLLADGAGGGLSARWYLYLTSAVAVVFGYIHLRTQSDEQAVRGS